MNVLRVENTRPPPPVRRERRRAEERSRLPVQEGQSGHGLGTRLVEECLAFAREAGHRRVTLWTTANLTSARRIYEHFGFTLIDEEPQHSFGHDLVGRHWGLELPPPHLGSPA
ncbi:GNAT family N-acetyltransferase [Streptomyces sp. NPDC058867]|uniref:GNAT family N-acetyltransferase n=1 Tax=unclassified Streptomyces TaxID=2593676 RepID=UPI00367D7F9C